MLPHGLVAGSKIQQATPLEHLLPAERRHSIADWHAAVGAVYAEIVRKHGSRRIAPICGTSDAQPAARIVHVNLPWAKSFEGKVPVVCAVIEELLSLDEVHALHAWANESSDWETHAGHLRMQTTDATFVYKLYLRMERFAAEFSRGHAIAGLNEHLRFLKYKPGHYFLPHTDGMITSRLDNVYRMSLMSAILYLSDPEDDGGGGTRFIAPDCPTYAATGRCDWKCDHCVDAPVTKGSMLLFAQDLMHAGTEPRVKEKFAMRSDVMYFDPKEEAKAKTM